MRRDRTCPIRSGLRASLARLGRFRREDEGSMLVFGLYMLVLMLMIGGIAVDVMRFEYERSRLQGTLDRAVLAAASLSQTRAPSDVVKDYVAKAGLSAYLDEPVVNANSLNMRSVSATAEYNLPTVFMKLMDIDTLAAPAASTAEERVTNVEISLVLDVSDSMNSNSRLVNLRTAAKDFIETVLTGANTGLAGAPKISISIVPYSGQANAGADLLGTYPNRKYGQSYSYCVDFQADDYTTTAISPTAALIGATNGETWNGSSNFVPTFYWCPKSPANVNAEILPLGTDATTLKDRITAMTAQGSTAIDIGMKWGVALLDPSLRPNITALKNAGKIDANFAGRPYDYTATDTMKVIVLMSDGEHVNNEPRMVDDHKTGVSDVWYDTSKSATAATSYSLYDATRKQWYWPYDSKWHSSPRGATSCVATASTCGTASHLSYPDLWNKITVAQVSAKIFAPAYGVATNYYYNKWISWTANTTKDTRALQMCTAAKGKGITVYTVAFEAPTGGQALLKSCASTSGHFYNVNSLEIVTAFRSIASHITQLRLTQ